MEEGSLYILKLIWVLIWMKKYKVVQIWPGQTVTSLHKISPGHIWTTLYKPFTVVSAGVVTGIPLIHQTMNPSTEKFLDCCYCNQCATTPVSLSKLNFWAFSTFLSVPNKHMGATTEWRFWVAWGTIQYVPRYEVHDVLNSADHVKQALFASEWYPL